MTKDPKQETIDTCWPIARAMALAYREHHGTGKGGMGASKFSKERWNGQTYQAASFASPGTIEYRLHPGADVSVINLDIADAKPEDIHVGPIVPAGEQRIIRTDIVSRNNRTSEDAEWELEYRDLNAKTNASSVAREMGASIAASLRQSVGYGSEMYGIQGETEIEISAEATFREAIESALTEHSEHEVTSTGTYTLKAMRKTVLERIESIGPAQQTIKARGELKFGFKLHAAGEWWKKWETTPAFLSEAIGIDVGDQIAGGGTGNWVQPLRHHPTPEYLLAPIRTPVYSEVEKVRKFEEARNVEIDYRWEALDSMGAVEEALRVIAEYGEGEMKKLAQAALS